MTDCNSQALSSFAARSATSKLNNTFLRSWYLNGILIYMQYYGDGAGLVIKYFIYGVLIASIKQSLSCDIG